MNFIKKLLFILSLSAVPLSVKIEAQIADCGGTYNGLSGTISSPNYPSYYSNNLNCYYYIQRSPPNYVNITFLSFETQLTLDWLEVSCSNDSTMRTQRFSGSVLPSPLSIPPCSNVSLQFRTDDSVVFQGFRLIYNMFDCGGTFSNLSGTISSPNYPYDYNNNLNCSYYIQISPPNSVGIAFMSFATESCCDWLEVSCSSNSSALAPQKFSGSVLPSYLSIPPCSSVLLLFHTDGSVANQGFRLRYIVGGGCGGTYSNISGTISSPNYPSNYDNNLNCSYYIQISPPNSVNITFISFATESGYDWLQVSCTGNSAILAQKFDGNHLPPFLSIRSCSRVQLLFRSDSYTTAQGFSLRYDIGNGLQGGLMMKPSNVSVRSDTTEPIVLSCSSRTIQPDLYPWWSFSTDGILFRIITASDCSVFSSIPNSSPLYYSTARQDSTGTCNLTISPYYLNSAVGFYTCADATLDYATARVTSYIVCGRTFTNLSGTISSPNYPYDYNNNLNCSYYIQMSPPNSVGITFISFSMEYNYDWLEVSCSSDSSILVQRFTGSVLPPYLSIPPCSSVLLLLRTDSFGVRQGFRLRYTIGGGCGAMLSNLSGTISSPNYPSNYDNDLNCSYYIQISPPNSVNITFISFATESCCDWLQVSCAGNSAIPAQRFYGTDLPPFLSIRSCSKVQLLFRTDSSTVYQGFSLRYDIGNGLQGGLTMKPSNLYVRGDTTEPIVLSCSSRAIQPDVYPWWSFSTDGTLFRIITAPDCSVFSSLPYSSSLYYLTARQDSTGTCNLTISPSYLNYSVGYYTCTDATLDYASALVASPIVPSFTVTDLTYPGSEVVPVRGDQISITCSFRVLPTTSRYLQFTPSVYIYSDDNQRPIATSNNMASIIVLASPEVLPSYVCNISFSVSYSYFPSKSATNLPQNISMMIPSRPVLYWPDDKTMLIQGHDNGRVVTNGILTCFVSANPPVTYQWTHEETNRLWKGPTVTVSNNGRYTCTATNNIRGVMYEVSKSINVTITPALIDFQQTSPYTEKNQLNITALIIGVVLGSAVLLIVLAIVVYFCLRKKKTTARNVNDYDMDPVTRTDGGHQNNSYLYDNMIALDGQPPDRVAVGT